MIPRAKRRTQEQLKQRSVIIREHNKKAQAERNYKEWTKALDNRIIDKYEKNEGGVPAFHPVDRSGLDTRATINESIARSLVAAGGVLRLYIQTKKCVIRRNQKDAGTVSFNCLQKILLDTPMQIQEYETANRVKYLEYSTRIS